ncbi:hypothetical protein I3843_12G102600 [Carya illinoinensis]|nr:hypothetical protein I3760_12G100700 [Carya illinoinensis]KAG7953294.1 hypothetical protein I3843_12G102600 [Carya illinoinensis]
MISPTLTFHRRLNVFRIPSASYRSLQTFPSERHSDIVRRPGGLITVPRRLKSAPATSGSLGRPTKLLLNVTIERSLGPVQVVMPPENTIRDLIKEVLEIYDREKRRPLLPKVDPRRFELHYSQFSLESLKPEEKLINLGSRNFFLCLKQSTSTGSTFSEKVENATEAAFPLARLMDFLL